MLKNYFKVAYRNMLRHKGFSFINIIGLALGLTACLLIGLFVYDELQYDKFLPEGDRVYRVYNTSTSENSSSEMASVPPMFGTTLEESFPEVEATNRIIMMQWDGQNLLEGGDKKLYEKGMLLADPTFFTMFPLEFIYGSPEKALDDPTSVVISDKVAEKVFGNIDPVGKKLMVNKSNLLVKGVFSTDQKFHLPVNLVLPLAAMELPPQRMKSWGWQQFYTYVRLKEGTDPAAVESKFNGILKKQIDPETGKPYEFVMSLQPLHQIHLYSASFKFDQAIRGNITYVKALSIIALFILLIACFNFVNLTTAKSLQRAKEVGVRKAIGAGRGQLVLQFLGETFLLTLISVIFAAALTSLFLPALNSFTDKEMTFNLFTNPVYVLWLVGLTVVVGVLAGLYPALVLSGFKPVKVLKSAAVMSDSGFGRVQWFRQGLIVVQFALSIFLIISALVVYQQVNFLHNKDLGFSKEQIMFFPMRGTEMNQNVETFKTELKKGPGISNVSIGYGFPGDATAGDGITIIKDGEKKNVPVTQLMVDHDYLSTLNVQLVAGRGFSREFPTDKDAAFLINETAVKELGYGTPQQALGQKMEWKMWTDGQDTIKRGEVIGVVKDFHFASLYDKVAPTVLQIYPPAYWKVAVKINSENLMGAINHVKTVWDKFSPEYPVDYIFMDDNFEKMYKSEEKLRTLMSIFTGIAIFVSCMGLFGLAAFAAERRKKEIGIRKILGAETSSIVTLLSKEFLALVVVASIMASPLAWYAMGQWLEDFAYRIDIPVWAFLLAFGLAGLLAFLTVSFQAFKAATSNPVRNLRMD